MPSFLAYSGSGNASGNLVYVNYGTELDFKTLANYSISLNGSIAIIRYGKIFRGSKVRAVKYCLDQLCSCTTYTRVDNKNHLKHK